MTENKAKLTFLGTGTSQGVPIIGCDCPVCTSGDSRDKRFRSSALVEYGGLTVLIDCGPDFRSQMLRAGVSHVDAILLTHNHKDHTGGLDDVRSLNLCEKKPVNIYCQQYVIDAMKKDYSYAFAEKLYPGAPIIRMKLIGGGVGDEFGAKPFEIHSNLIEPDLVWESGKGWKDVGSEVRSDPRALRKVTVIPIQGWHHKAHELSVLGYRFGNIAYLTDLNNINDCEFEKLKGLDYVTVNSVKYTKHYSHFSLPEALEFFDRVGARQSYLTHISHLFPVHEQLDRELQAYNPSYHVAYDGLVLE